jgi:gluconokinase
MGVAGSGKTALGHALADVTGAAFLDGDRFHDADNVAKMRRGIPLTDIDREKWLAATGTALLESCANRPTIVACSALKRQYREHLRAAAPGVRFVFLDISPELAESRVAARPDHFMPVSLVASQFDTLERPDVETDVFPVDARQPLAAVVAFARCVWQTP